MGSYEVGQGRRVVARLPRGGDLAGEILDVARAYKVEAGQVWAIGAVQQARIAYYDQSGKAYQELDLDEPLQIASLVGNLSLRDGETALHAHAVFADRRGRTFGGHVVAGCVIYACELLLCELSGSVLEGVYDEATGLPLWRGL